MILTIFPFAIVLPNPLSGNGTNTNRRYRPINLRDLFIAPPFDELDVVAMDGTGEPRRLTNSQLKSLREKGFVIKTNFFNFFCFHFCSEFL